MSRTVLFREAFNDFTQKYFINTGIMCYWDLCVLTKNTRKNVHDFELVFPNTYLAYHLDVRVVLDDGTSEGPGPIYLPQEIPPLDDYLKEAHAYFGKFGNTTSDDIHNPWSEIGVRIGVPKTNDKGNTIIDICVVYRDKCKYPYPTPLTKEEFLEKKLEEATKRAREAEERLQKTIKERNCYLVERDSARTERDQLNAKKLQYCNYIHNQKRTIESQTAKLAKLERTFKKMAKEVYIKEGLQDCPVCFEEMTAEKLDTTYCGHNVCIDCNKKCKLCPLCRERY